MSFIYNPGFTPYDDIMSKVQSKIEDMAKSLNFKGIKNELNNVIFTLTQLIDLIHTKKIEFPYWQLPIEGLLTKLSFHSSSICQIAINVPIFKRTDGNIISAPDLSSVYVVSRAQIECFLILNYLILSPKDSCEGEFRHLLYKLSGLIHRQSYHVTLPENIAKKKQEFKEIEALKEEIVSHSYFLTLTKEEQNKVTGKNPPAKLLSWINLIEQSRLRNDIFLSTWKLYSNHAHSEFISAIQLESYMRDNAGTQKTMYLTLEATIMLVSITITELLNLLPTLIINYENLVKEEDRCYVFCWSLQGFKRFSQA